MLFLDGLSLEIGVAANALVAAVPGVVVDPAVERLRLLSRVLVGVGVSPLTQHADGMKRSALPLVCGP